MWAGVLPGVHPGRALRRRGWRSGTLWRCGGVWGCGTSGWPGNVRLLLQPSAKGAVCCFIILFFLLIPWLGYLCINTTPLFAYQVEVPSLWIRQLWAGESAAGWMGSVDDLLCFSVCALYLSLKSFSESRGPYCSLRVRISWVSGPKVAEREKTA